MNHSVPLTTVTNPFWTAVCGTSDPVEPPEISAPTLDAAARTAFATAGRRYGFRRPRELVDIDGRFRHFTFRGGAFVGKRTGTANARREVRNSRLAAKRLLGSTMLEPQVPLLVPLPGATDSLLVTEDCGPSLAHRPAEIQEHMPWDRFLNAMNELLEVGIEWPGFLPRNVIASEGGALVFIDWESCRLLSGRTRCRRVGDLSLLFWSIAWANCYERDAMEFGDEICRVLDLTTRTDPLDDFELAYASMLGAGVDRSTVRHRCSRATIRTESIRSSAHPDMPLEAADVGHLLNELLPAHLSVLYTFASSGYIDRRGQDTFAAFVRLVVEVLTLMTPADGLEGQPVLRRRLQFTLLAVIAAVLLEDVNPDLVVGASSERQLLRQLGDSSAAVRSLLDHGSDAGSVEPVTPCLHRILLLARQSLDVDSTTRGSQLTKGLQGLGNEISQLASAYFVDGASRD